jgi:cell division protein FtsB
MALTPSEKARMKKAEETLVSLQNLIEGAASTNQLNRLLVLANEEIRRLTERVETLETKVNELLDLAKKLQ